MEAKIAFQLRKRGFDRRQVGVSKTGLCEHNVLLGVHAMTSRPAPARLRLVLPTLETLEEDHAIQRILCNDLEAVADNLPALPSTVDVRRLCDRIMRVTATHFVRAEQVLDSLPAEQRPSAATLEILHAMHQLDELHGHDLIVALWQHVGRANGSHVGQLAYMLRCFFDGCRRAIALKESLLTLAQRPVAMTG
jgi:hypothetical protein